MGRLTEGVEVIERLWMGEPVTYEGRHFQLRDVRISLRPVQRPRPRIWLAANTDAGVKRAARLGDAWLMNPHSTLPSIERQLALFHETRARSSAGRAPTDIPLIKECVVAEDARTALAEARPFLEAKYRAYQQWKQDEALPEGETFDLSFEDLARDRFIVGDPARAVDEIAALSRAARHHRAELPRAVAGHAAGDGAAHDPPAGREGPAEAPLGRS